MTDFEWDLAERWVSNNGCGPYVARVLAVDRGVAEMERWRRDSRKHRVRFSLPVKFLLSRSCGWRREASAPEATP